MKKILALTSSIILLGTMAFALTGCSDSPFVKALQNASDKTGNITATFDGIEIVSDTADLTFVPSNECKIEYTTHKRITYSTEVENGVLKIKLEDSRHWFEKMFSLGDSSKLTVYLPAGEYSSLTIKQATGDINVPADYKFGSVNIKLSTGDTKFSASASEAIEICTSTGDITLENVSCGSLKTKVSTGKTTLTNVAVAGDAAITVSNGKSFLTNVSCTNFTSTGDTGDINMTSLIASERIDITRTTGDVYFGGCDAAEIYVETKTGDVNGTFLTDKIFQAHTSSGKINVPECWEGGKCKITTTTGKIEISIGQ